MKKLLGLAAFLLILYLLMLFADESARSLSNHFNLGKRIGLYGIISLGAGMLIITGGIDLSIGSVVGFCCTVFALLLTHPRCQWHPAAAIAAVLGIGALIGLVNGLIVAKLKVQAFVVTLCGLFIYRGASRWLAGDTVQGLGNSFVAWKYWLAKSHDVLGLPMSLVIFLALAAVATVFLHFSIYGRYFFAIGSNEQAARYAGVATDRYRILAYVLCSTLAAFFAVLFLMEENSVQPSSTGNFFELYAIAGAVLGGCSLRGGEGSVLGVLIGTAIIRILPTFTQMLKVPSSLEYTVIGTALLLGALLDELLRRRSQKRG
ncbi:MAG TPA: ABC transporter permease [Pirellulales bacterium]|nr:ABC transporter permease [Pirellulales bacterium]